MNGRRSRPLPTGWAASTVSAIAEVLGGGTPDTRRPDFWGGDIPWITSADIHGVTDIRPRKTITELGLRHSPTHLVHRGSVIVVTRVGLGKVALVPESLCFSQDSQALVFDATLVEPSYLAHHLSERVAEFRWTGRGTTIAGVTKRQLKNLEVLVPPLTEQRRIVAEIEKHFTRLDAVTAALRRARANLARYRASVLKAAVEGRFVPTEADLARQRGRSYEPATVLLERILRERRTKWEGQLGRRGKDREPERPDTSNLPPVPEGWTWATLDQLLSGAPQNGVYRNQEAYGRGTPILRIEDYQDFSVQPADRLSRVGITAEEAAKYRLRVGDLIINRVNSLTHLGKCLVVSDSLAGVVHESNMMRLSVSEEADSRYVSIYLRSTSGRARLTGRAKWAVNQASINQVDVKMVPVPLPPLVEQKRIVAEIEHQIAAIDATQEAIGINLSRTARLRQAILRAGFEGALAPQDPTDEPASVLLERIRTQRSQISSNGWQARRSRRPAGVRV